MSGPLAILQARAQLYARAGLSTRTTGYLRQNGFDLRSLGDPDPIAEHCGVLAVVPIFILDGDRFDFADRVPAGERRANGDPVAAAVVEVFGRDGGTAIDLAAWPVDDPSQLLTMFGAAAMLGVANVHAAATYAFKPLAVHRTALGWLQAGCRGAV